MSSDPKETGTWTHARYRASWKFKIVEAQMQSAVARRAGQPHRWGIRVVERVFSSLPPFTAARAATMALRALGVRVGEASVFWGMPSLVGTGDICARLSVGTYCGFNARCYFELDDKIAIGDHVAVGQDVMFLTRTHDTSNSLQRAGKAGSAPIEVGNGAWLGARCTIMPGVKIGAGCVIGASVVVAKDVPPNILVMGNRSVSLAKWR